MATYERSTRVDAPLSEVWELHVSVGGLPAVSPDWFDLRVEDVRQPEGDHDPEILVEGTVIVSSVRPFGVGPRRRWTSEIVELQRDEDRATFRDVMTEGPFPTWEHTHRFVAEDGATQIHDRVKYQLPGGPIGRLLGPFAFVGLEPTFRYRHRRTRELLESRDRQ